MKKIAATWGFFQDVIVENLCRVVLFGIIFLAALEVVRRYILGATFIWYQDVAVYFNMAVVFIYMGVTLRHDNHIRLTLLIEALRRKGGVFDRLADMIEIIGSAIGIIICIIFVRFGIDFVAVGRDFGRRTESAGLLIWPFYVLLVLGFVFMAVESAIKTFKFVNKVRGNA